MNVMFICTGNICRSAMAEAMLKKILKDKNIKNVMICSCGVYADTGDVPTSNAIEAMKEYDVDLKTHRATNIKQSNIKEMDLILCATSSHKNIIQAMYPELADKVFTMKEYAGKTNDIDISDPWGYNLEIYRKCATEIYDCLNEILRKFVCKNS